MPHLEYELGLGWTSPSGHWRFTTGYMLSHWANVVTTPEFIDAVQADNYTDVDGNLTFNGAVIRVEFGGSPVNTRSRLGADRFIREILSTGRLTGAFLFWP